MHKFGGSLIACRRYVFELTVFRDVLIAFCNLLKFEFEFFKGIFSYLLSSDSLFVQASMNFQLKSQVECCNKVREQKSQINKNVDCGEYTH